MVKFSLKRITTYQKQQIIAYVILKYRFVLCTLHIVYEITQDGNRLRRFLFQKNYSPRLVDEAEVGKTDFMHRIMGKGKPVRFFCDVRLKQVDEHGSSCCNYF